MDPSKLNQAIAALNRSKRYSDYGQPYLSYVSDKIETMRNNTMSERQQDLERRIAAYMKAYGDKPEFIEKILELHEINQLPSRNQVKAWY